jgi:hypothetical protein
MKKIQINIITIGLFLIVPMLSHGMAKKLHYKTLFSKANGSESVFNSFWDTTPEEKKIIIKKALIRQHYSVSKKLNEFNLNNRYFSADQLKSGLWYLIPTTAYTGACMFGLYTLYKSLTRDNGTIEDLLTSTSKASILWYGFSYTLPYFKKGLKKIKKGAAPRHHLKKKLNNVTKTLHMIKSSKETFREEAIAAYKKTFQNSDEEEVYIV